MILLNLCTPFFAQFAETTLPTLAAICLLTVGTYLR